ncbi:MAG: outer membrane lipoprotein carrier protein LolA [Flavobacteriales bacterium]
MMKRTFLLLASSLLLNVTTNAQDDTRSRAIVDKLVGKSKTWTSFEADFATRLQSTKDKLDVKQAGTIQTKGKKFNLVLADNTIINDGTALYTYNKENNEVTISDPAEMDQELDPSKLFTLYEKGFKSQFVEEKADATGAMMQTIKLFPLDAAKKPYHTIVLTVDKSKEEARQVQILYKDGNIVTYSLKRFVANPALADALFVFDKSKHPGVEVNDMR